MIIYLVVMSMINGFIIGLLYGVGAMAFVLIYKSSLVVNFAQGEFLLVGAWACWGLLATFSMPFYMAFLLTLLFMMLFGILVQIIILKPLIGEPIISIIMVTIGLSIFFQAIMNWMFGVFTEPFPQIFSSESLNIFGLNVHSSYCFSNSISSLFLSFFYLFLERLYNS